MTIFRKKPCFKIQNFKKKSQFFFWIDCFVMQLWDKKVSDDGRGGWCSTTPAHLVNDLFSALNSVWTTRNKQNSGDNGPLKTGYSSWISKDNPMEVKELHRFFFFWKYNPCKNWPNSAVNFSIKMLASLVAANLQTVFLLVTREVLGVAIGAPSLGWYPSCSNSQIRLR